jgi:hypothetical protein
MPNPYGEFVPDPLAPSGFRWRRHDEQPATTMLPTVQPRNDSEPFGDVGDWVDPNAPDPTPDEVTDLEHPDYVHPWFGA